MADHPHDRNKLEAYLVKLSPDPLRLAGLAVKLHRRVLDPSVLANEVTVVGTLVLRGALGGFIQ